MSIPQRGRTASLWLPVLLCALSAPLAAQQRAGGGPADQGVSAEAQAIVDRMTAYLRRLPAFSIEAQTTRDEVLAFGYKMQNNETSRLAFQKPGKLRVEVDGDIRNRVFYYNGATLTMYAPDEAAFTRTAAPGSLKELIDGLLDAGVEMPLIDVLYQIGQGRLTADVSAGGLVGESRIDGVDCYHLAFRQATLDWQMWVQKGERPLPKRIVITDRFEYGNPQYQTTLRWNVQPKFGASEFEFSATEGVNEIPFKSAVSIKTDAAAGEK
jgi:hypothetical protein